MEQVTDAPAKAAAPDARHPLARDLQGTPFEVPAAAIAWRVRRGGGKRGRPRNVFDADGRPLEIPIGASLHDLTNEGCEAGRYQLYPIDAEGRIVPGLVAVTEVADEDGEERPPASSDEPSAIVNHMLATIRAQSDALCRALEATTSGYSPVRAVQAPVLPPPLPPQVIVEAAPSAPETPPINTEAVMGLVMKVWQMFAPMFAGASNNAPINLMPNLGGEPPAAGNAP